MNCIDAVEGTSKVVLARLLDQSTEFCMDASEYIRITKVVIDAVATYVGDNPEISDMPDLIRTELYDYAKAQWLARLEKNADPEQDPATGIDLEYQSYCYDYVYAHGNYPR
jgi:hypothetical protein